MMKKRLLAWVLVLVLALGLLPMSALAASEENTSPEITAEDGGDRSTSEEPEPGSEPVTNTALTAEPRDGEVNVSIQTTWAFINAWNLYAYSDKENQDAVPIATKKTAAPLSLAPGDYWLEGFMKAQNAYLGGIKLTVDAEHTQFKLCGSQRIGCGNTDWVENTDYTKTVEVHNQDNTITREIELGVLGKNNTLIALENDTVVVTITPSEAKKAEGYEETVGQTNPLTSYENISVTCQSSVHLTVTAPAGSDILVGQQQGYYTYLYETPTATSSDAGGVSSTYNLRQNTTYFYRVSHPDGVTYWKFNQWTGDSTADVTAEDLHLNDSGFTKSTVIRDFSSNESDVGSIFLNINEKGYLALEQGNTYSLNVSRSWQAIEGISNKETALPDMHYTVIDPETGSASGVVSIAPDTYNSSVATLTAEEAGTAIVLVTYDAMSYPGALGAIKTSEVGDPKFSAIWPENTGVFVVSVGSDGSAITTNMTINEGKNDTKVEKLVGDALDAELDVLYYVEGTDGASYTFTPESGCTVSVLHPTLTQEKMTYSGGFEETDVAVDSGTGAVTVSGLTEGRHIVKVTKEGVSTYQVITAKPLTYTITNATTKEPVTEETVLKPGDRVTIQYSGLFDPAGKMAGVYNFNTGIHMEAQTGEAFNGGSGLYGVYTFPSTPAFQMVTVTVPLYTTSDTLDLSACLRQRAYGSPLGSHRGLDYALGKNPDFAAPEHNTLMGCLPSITLKVEYDKTMPVCRIQPMDGDRPIEDFTIVDLKDEKGNLVHPTEGVFRAPAGTYTFAIQASGYLYYQGSVTVTADGENSFPIPLTRLGANPWDGTTLTEPQKDGAGTYLIGTGAELAWYITYLADSSNDRAVNAKLTADIELAGYPFITGAFLYGTFDGAGHAINHLNIHHSSSGGARIGGIFSGIGGYGTKDGVTQNGAVKNVTVNGTIDVTVSIGNAVTAGPVTIGGIVGTMMWANDNYNSGNPNRSTVVTNCVSNVDIVVTCDSDGSGSNQNIIVGGIVGSSLGYSGSDATGNIGFTQLSDCVNNGKIEVTSSGSASANTSIGGITGETGLGTELTNVSNHGAVNVRVSNDAIRDMSVGGVAGRVYYNQTTTAEGGTDTATTLEHLWNTGAVSAVYEGDGTASYWYQGMRIGGIAGSLEIHDNLSIKSFAYAYNQGAVDAQWQTQAEEPDVGGIIGWISPNTGEAFEASNLYTTQGVVLGGTRYEADGSNYVYTFTNSYHQAQEETLFGTKLDAAVLNLTAASVQESDKTGVQDYIHALKCVPNEALTQADQTNLVKLERLMGVLGETVSVSVEAYDFAAKNAGLAGASETGTVANYTAEVPMGSTAAEAMQRAFDAHGLVYVMEYTAYGKYLTSVGDLAASGSGGWMLARNGDRFDNLGLDAVTVDDGDVLELHYTVDGGTDIGAASMGMPILTSLTLGGTTVTMEKETDWSSGSAQTTYYLVSGQGKSEMAGTGSVSDPFVVHVVVPEGTDLTDLAANFTTCLDEDYATVTGLETSNFSGDVDVTLASRTGGVTCYTVKVSVKPSSSTGGPGEDGRIRVSFRLIGSTRAKNVDLSEGESGFHDAEYETWIRTKDYRLDENATVGDLFVTALDGAGLRYKGLEDNYISSITAPSAVGGYELKEFTNGKFSGWMYTVNGGHPAFGLNSFGLNDGDVVVWHYVNDYRYEVEDWFDGTLGTEQLWNRWLDAADVNPTSASVGANDKDQTAANEAASLINAIGKVTEDSGEAIRTARKAYDMLTPDQKKLVENYDVLLAAEKEYAGLTGTLPFVDVDNGDWFYEAVKYAYGNGLFNGTSATVFSPNREMTRAMLVTVLYRLDGEPAVTKKNTFADVLDGQYYTDAVLWASANGMVSGVGGNRFQPNDSITREQMATVLMRYAQYKKYDTAGSASLARFSDSGLVSGWADEAMRWAVGSGLLNGRTATMLVPTGTPTRAEVATILMRMAAHE